MIVVELVVVLTAFRLVTVCVWCGERDRWKHFGLGVIENEYCTNG